MLTICSPLAGRVVAHCTNPDGSVQAGDPLLIVESMKMEIPVASPARGKIKTILVQIDDMVDEGQSLMVLEI